MAVYSINACIFGGTACSVMGLQRRGARACVLLCQLWERVRAGDRNALRKAPLKDLAAQLLPVGHIVSPVRTQSLVLLGRAVRFVGLTFEKPVRTASDLV
eukprot:4819968-Pleurochrysis_carterae.AAC.2